MKTHNLVRVLAFALLGTVAVGCGGKSKGKSGLTQCDDPKTCKVPPPPCLPGDPGCKVIDKGPDTVSVDARKDFAAAVAFYTDVDAKGWDAGSCKAAAEKFAAVAREHSFVEAQYMVGRSYHNCDMAAEAEKAYQAALQIKSDHAPSISNLGELYYAAGKREGAKKYWESAVKADPKIVAARANLAMLLLEDLRVTKDDAQWKKMEQEARDHLSSVLAVNNDHLKAYVLYGLVYMEGRDKNKNRLDLSKLLLDEGSKRLKEGQKFAPLEHAYGLYYLYKNNLTQAMTHFQAAVDIDPNFAEAHENVALINLGYRKYDIAKEHFQRVLQLQDNKNYDSLVGLGIAQRGLNDLDGAEASYNSAKALDGKRGEAIFNLGVLYKDFRASNAGDNKTALDLFKKAREYFKDATSKTLLPDDLQEAKDNITDCDKSIKVYEEAMKLSASGGDS